MNINIKKRSIIILVLALLFVIGASAHPGRTDENSGHWNRKTGEYNFHDGRYAGKKSSSNSSSSDNSNFVPPYEPPTKEPQQQEIEQQETKDYIYIILGTFAITSLGLILLYCFFIEPGIGCLTFSFFYLAFPCLILWAERKEKTVLLTVISTVILFVIIISVIKILTKPKNKQ